jgi:hypothetical protein
MPFEVFQRQRAPRSPTPYVTVHRRGTVSLNAAAWQALGDPKALELLYDSETNRMALRATTDDQSHAYLPRSSGRDGRVRVVSGTAFFQYYGLLFDRMRRYAGKLEDDMLVVDLGSPESEGSPPPSRKTSTAKRSPRPIGDP